MARPPAIPRLPVCALLLGAVLVAACSSPEPVEVEVEVRSVGVDPSSRAPVVILQDRDGKTALPIWIGRAEAEAIALQMEGISPPRPMTHDLMKSVLDTAGIGLDRVVIVSLREGTYYARLHLSGQGEEPLEVDARPSDAIALAVRFDRPIFVATALLQGDNSIRLEARREAGSAVHLAGITVQDLSDELADYFGVPPGSGVVVSAVEDGGFGELQRGDVILEIDGSAVSGARDFETKVSAAKPGRGMQLSVQRDRRRLDVRVEAD